MDKTKNERISKLRAIRTEFSQYVNMIEYTTTKLNALELSSIVTQAERALLHIESALELLEKALREEVPRE